VEVAGTTRLGLSNLTLDGDAAGNGVDGCSNDVAGVFFSDASGMVSDVDLTGWAPQTNVGCGSGHGVMAEAASGGTSAVTVVGSEVSGYGTSSIFAAGDGTSLTATGDTVTGTPTDQVATNGIAVDFGAAGSLADDTVSGNDDTGNAAQGAADDPQSNDAAGALFYGASGCPAVTASTLDNDQIGVESVDSSPVIGGSQASQGNTIEQTGS
jgi:hypothetical protein